MKKRRCWLPESRLERYLFGLLPEQIAGSIYAECIEKIEDHLLICPQCLGRAEAHDLLVRTIRDSRKELSWKTLSAGASI